jgi:hypothetical protein
MHDFFHYFSSKSCLIAPPPTSSHCCSGLACISPSLTHHHVTLAFAPPSCMPWLVEVALALVAPFSSRPCPSQRATSASCLPFASCSPWLVVAPLLIAPPPPHVASCHAATSHRCAGWLLHHLLSRCRRLASALLMPLHLTMRQLAVTLPLIMPPSCSRG